MILSTLVFAVLLCLVMLVSCNGELSDFFSKGSEKLQNAIKLSTSRCFHVHSMLNALRYFFETFSFLNK